MATLYNYRRGAGPAYRDRYVVPRLELDVIATPPHERYNDVRRRPPQYRDDARRRRARTDHAAYRGPRTAARPERRYVTARAVSDGGFDPGLYARRGVPEARDDDAYRYRVYQDDVQDEFETARVSMYTHDSSDPYSCTCYPRASSKTIPTMMYDGVRCPHPEHVYQPAKQDFFTYPWTVQTHRPRSNRLPPLPFGYREGQQKPPSAVTAPPFVTYHSKDIESLRQRMKAGNGEKPPPHSAPEEKNYVPLLSAEPSDRRLRRTNRRKLASMPTLPTLDEDITPFDSVSQVAVSIPPPRAFRRDSLRLHTVDGVTARTVDAGLRDEYNPRTKALSTPRFRPPPLDHGDFPQTPTRIFRGEYVDPNSGLSYKYDIKYGRTILGGTKRLKTV